MLSGSGSEGVGAAGAGVAPDGLVPERASATTLAPEHFQADVVPFAFTQARTLAPLSPAGGTKVALLARAMATHLVTVFFLTVTFFWVCHWKRYVASFAAGVATDAVRVPPTWALPVTTGARTAGAACRVTGRAMAATRTAASRAGSRGERRLITVFLTPHASTVPRPGFRHRPSAPATEWAAPSRTRCGLPRHRGSRPPAARRTRARGETRLTPPGAVLPAP